MNPKVSKTFHQTESRHWTLTGKSGNRKTRENFEHLQMNAMNVYETHIRYKEKDRTWSAGGGMSVGN